MPARDDEPSISLRKPLLLDRLTPRAGGPLSLHDEAEAIRAQVDAEQAEALRQGLDFDADLELPQRLLTWANEHLQRTPADEALMAVVTSAQAATEACTALAEARHEAASAPSDATTDALDSGLVDEISFLDGIDATA